MCVNESKCISNSFKCDHDNDCEDGSDEVNCTMHLSKLILIGIYLWLNNISNKFDKFVIFYSLLNPGISRTCLPNEYQCNISRKCISLSQKCNGVRNCGLGDQSDEENCGKNLI